MKAFLIIALPFLTGIIYSFAFAATKKFNFTKISRFALDFAMTLSLTFFVYAPCFFLYDGNIMVRAVIAAIVGFVLPRLFFRRAEENS